MTASNTLDARRGRRIVFNAKNAMHCDDWTELDGGFLYRRRSDEERMFVLKWSRPLDAWRGGRIYVFSPEPLFSSAKFVFPAPNLRFFSTENTCFQSRTFVFLRKSALPDQNKRFPNEN